MKNPRPILYSFRRCPYAIRARLALAYAGVSFELREVSLQNKPAPMLAISPKGTVPVLQCPDGAVLDESLDIMLWALRQNDPGQWGVMDEAAYALVGQNDAEFKFYLDRYKYAGRYPEHPASYYRQQAGWFLASLEDRLTGLRYLGGGHCSLVDAAIFPFVRQFAAVDENEFRRLAYPALSRWLKTWLESPLFAAVMAKHPVWPPSSEPQI